MIRSAFLFLVAMLSSAPAAAATNCSLKQLASIDMKVTTETLFLPVTIGGAQREFTLLPSSGYNFISRRLATELGLTLKEMNPRVEVTVRGRRIKNYTTVADFQIGALKVGSMDFIVGPEGAADEPAEGYLSLRTFTKADIELDMAGGKLNLFSQDHCPGNVVYWTSSGFGQLPFKWEERIYLRPEMELDGQPVRVAFEADGPSRIGMKRAKSLFGIDESSPGMAEVSRSQSGERLFRYPFKNLTAGGLSVLKPNILIISDPAERDCSGKPLLNPSDGAWSTCYGGKDITLGLSVLSKLRIYVSMKERVLYLTPASAK